VISRTDKSVKILIVSFLLAIFLSYYGSVNLFYHSHIVLGDTIVHSHPFKSDNSGKPIHSHNDKGFVTIQLLTYFLIFTLITATILDSVFYSKAELIVRKRLNREFSTSRLVNSLRAPPAYRL